MLDETCLVVAVTAIPITIKIEAGVGFVQFTTLLKIVGRRGLFPLAETKTQVSAGCTITFVARNAVLLFSSLIVSIV
jgi:hypothetical protein